MNLNQGRLRKVEKFTEISIEPTLYHLLSINFILGTKVFLLFTLVLKSTLFSPHMSPLCDLMKKRNFIIRGRIAEIQGTDSSQNVRV